MSRALLGGSLAAVPGVALVTALWRQPPDTLVSMRINERTPKSRYDAFCLSLMRARCDAIVTSGKILRDEPSLTHEVHGPERLRHALMAWRREWCGKAKPTETLVLTSGADIDWQHPVFHGEGGVTVFTGADAAARLARAGVPDGVRLVGRTQTGAPEAVRYLVVERRLSTVSVELGPSTARTLLAPSGGLNEIVLSVYEGDTIPVDVRGKPLARMDELRARFPRVSSYREVREPSGRWTFWRLLRDSSG
jgi:riboflavin biosynthesis pyrimidine reductase